jgi:hypothetical protein
MLAASLWGVEAGAIDGDVPHAASSDATQKQSVALMAAIFFTPSA